MNWYDAKIVLPKQNQQVLIACVEQNDKNSLYLNDSDYPFYSVAEYVHESQFKSDLGWRVITNCSGYEYEDFRLQPDYWTDIVCPN